MNIAGLPDLILSWLKSQGTEQSQTGKGLALEQFKPGTQYEGKVLDLLPNGRNLVQVGNQAMDMALPKQANPGDVIRLTFVNSSPRLTFALNAATPPSAQPVNVSQAAQQVNALVRYVPVTPITAGEAAPKAVATPGATAATSNNPTNAPLPTAVKAAPPLPVASANLTAQAGAAISLTAKGATVINAVQLGGTTATAGTTSSSITTSTATSTSATIASGNPSRAGGAVLSANVVTGSASAASAGAAAAVVRPLVVNPALLLAPVRTGAITATPGPAIPGMAMTGEAVEGLRAALGSNSSLTTAQGVVAEKMMATNLLPLRLQQTVKESGLFYESHLGKWVRGEMSLESIHREPQARLLQTPGPLLNLPDLDGMPEEAARTASRQLHLLEGGPFLWQGQAWPGQSAEWLVRERDGRDGADQEEGQKWHSQLRLILPRLGELSADLDIGALGLRIRLKSPSPEALAEITAAMPELVQRLKDSELNLSSINAELSDGGQ